ncbi:MATE family efflux transporter [Silicimonas sp. MF1-12-2]|uniref:MATE family efflux transporter n=1 Tax=Silicimonas sp. MF1-12-2 TaxID=3384793 RepID=UPI0039B6742F
MHTVATPPTPRASVGGQVRSLLSLGLPLIGSHIAQVLIGVTDTVMLGWYDIIDLAALSVSAPIFYIVFIFGSGFAWAVTPMVASALAQNDERQVRRVTRMGLWLSVFFGILVIPVFFFAEAILLAIGQEPDVAGQAGIYMPFLGLGLIPALMVQVLKSYLSALELTRAILLAVIGSALLNAAANYLFIFGNFGAPELGIAGAGIASLVSHITSLAALCIYAVLKRPDHSLFRNLHRPDPEILRAVFTIGLPIGFTLLAEVGLFAASSIMMGWLGAVSLAAHGIALQIASLTFMIPLGLSQAVTVRVGRAWGRNDLAEMRAAALAGMILAGIAVVITISAFLLIPELLIGLFIDPGDPARPAILATGISLLAMAALFQLVDFGQVMGLGMLRGVQDTRVPMLMAIVSYWLIGLPVSYAMGFTAGWGGVGIWLGLSIGLAAACVGMQTRFWRRYGLSRPSS